MLLPYSVYSAYIFPVTVTWSALSTHSPILRRSLGQEIQKFTAWGFIRRALAVSSQHRGEFAKLTLEVCVLWFSAAGLNVGIYGIKDVGFHSIFFRVSTSLNSKLRRRC